MTVNISILNLEDFTDMQREFLAAEKVKKHVFHLLEFVFYSKVTSLWRKEAIFCKQWSPSKPSKRWKNILQEKKHTWGFEIERIEHKPAIDV